MIKSGKVNLRDNRIKRIKLASLAYFIAEDEISFYGLHWDLQYFRRSREFGFTGYVDLSESKLTEPTFFSLYGNKIFLILILLYIFLIFSFNKLKHE